MLARIVHDFLKWLWPAIFAGGFAFATLALAASQLWTEAKDWTASLFGWAIAVMLNPLFPWLVIALFVIWLFAFIWSGYVVKSANEAPVRYADPPERVDAKPARPAKDMPPLKDHFLSDFKNGAGSVVIEAMLHQDIEFPDGLKVQILYNQEFRFDVHAKFLSVYIPPCARTASITQYVADNIKGYLETGDLGFAVGGVGSEETKADELVFTGKVFVYHEDSLTLAQRGELDAYYRKCGLILQLRSREYVLSCLESARANDASK